MTLSSLHLMLTYQCNLACDHCFAWGSPWQTGTMTLDNVEQILQQAETVPDIQSIYFEGGEISLFYPLLVESVNMCVEKGFAVGIVTNAYWATSERDALLWLRPFAGKLQDISISSDEYHWHEALGRQTALARAAAEQLDIPVGYISVAQPQTEAEAAVGQLPLGESAVMFRGRAVSELVSKVPLHPWTQFDCCPYENLRQPGRVHVDPFGHMHICQGISIGNILTTPLIDILAQFDPNTHPILQPLISGGPTALAQAYDLPHQENYADACHLCDEMRRALRPQYPAILTPDQMYGVVS